MYNGKRNHHFIAQTEQGFHARNQDVTSGKVNRFEVIDKSSFQLKNTGRKGRAISNNLCFQDLYCFDFLSREEQLNFEDAFGFYECQYKILIEKVIASDPIDTEACFDLFIYKWMNIIRNPFCIKQTLEWFSNAIKLVPSNAELFEVFQRIESGNRPQEAQVCRQFNVTPAEYKNWLKVLFLVLTTRSESWNILEAFARAMFYKQQTGVSIFLVSAPKGHTTLFSDVGYTYLEGECESMYEFPLSHKHFIVFAFTDIERLVKTQAKLESEAELSEYLNAVTLIPSEVLAIKVTDNLDMLKAHNQRTVQQSHRYVFGQSTIPTVL